MKIIRIKLIFIVVIISISYIISYAQTDKQLDSLVRSKIGENSQLPNYHPKNDIEIIEHLKINYYKKKDSTFVNHLSLQIQNAPKAEVLNSIVNWLDEYNRPGYRNIEKVWDNVMEIFYSYDRCEALKYCEKHRMLEKIRKDDMYKSGSVQDPITVRRFPYLDFMYKNYPLTEVLPLILQDNDLNKEDTLWTAYMLYKDFSRNQCHNDTACINNAVAYIQNFFKLNKELKPKQYYLEAFISKNPTLTEYTRIRQEKLRQEKINKSKKN